MNKTRRNRSLHGAGGPARCPRLAVVCGALALVLMLATTGQAQTQAPAAPGQTDDPLRPLALEGAPDATTPWWRAPPEASGARLLSQTKLLVGAGLATAGILYCLPENVTKWDKEHKVEQLPDRWWDNVSRRPVWDKDNWFINYVGHPYCGGVYYQMARKSGFGQFHSLLYTTAMSTLFWEYGFEAFAERPSVQDLIFTPLGGWVYGEWAYRCEQRIEDNDKRVLGSRILGYTSLFFLDPIDSMGRGINQLFGKEWVMTGRITAQAGQTGHTPDMQSYGSAQPGGMGLGVQIRLAHAF